MKNDSSIKEAQEIIKSSEFRILIVGDEASKKDQLVESAHIEDVKYFNFKELCKAETISHLNENNFDLFYQDIFDSKEKVIVLNGVLFSDDCYDAKLCGFIKDARKKGKRLIVLTDEMPCKSLLNLFSFVINISEINFDRKCVIERVI